MPDPYVTSHHQAAGHGSEWAALSDAHLHTHTRRPPTGMIAWAFGLLVLLIPFVGVGSFLSGIAQIIAGLAHRSRGELAARNGVNAANWGALNVLISALGFIGICAYLAALYVIPRLANSDAGITVFMVGLVLFAVISVGIQLYAGIRGIIVTSRGEVLTLPAPRIFTLPEKEKTYGIQC